MPTERHGLRQAETRTLAPVRSCGWISKELLLDQSPSLGLMRAFSARERTWPPVTRESTVLLLMMNPGDEERPKGKWETYKPMTSTKTQ